MCTPFGKVDLISLPTNKETGNPRGFAFVDMSTNEELEAAVAGLNEASVGGRQIRVNKSLPKEDLPAKSERKVEDQNQKIYVGNLPFDVVKEELIDVYSEYGNVIEVYVPVNQANGSGRGFAFVTMSKEDAPRAIEATNGMDFGGRSLVVSEPLPPGEKIKKRAPVSKSFVQENQTKLYVGNLSFYTVEDTLIELFEEFGVVHDCFLPKDRETGGMRGFAFLTMDSDAAQRAIEELSGCELDGRAIKVNEAMPRD